MTTVFRLPEEPPVGTTVRPEPDTGERYERLEPAGPWKRWRYEVKLDHGMPGIAWLGWHDVLSRHPGGLVVVEADPHPTPWEALYDPEGAYAYAIDANGERVCTIFEPGIGTVDRRSLATRIVDAVNKAATT